MKRQELAKLVAEELGLKEKDVDKVIKTTLEAIVAVIKDDEEVDLYGFGKFSARMSEERTARNPQTGEAITVEAHKAPKFKFSSSVKKALR